jgi:hypothetical protein
VLVAQQFFTYDGTPNQPPVVFDRGLAVPAGGSLETEMASADPDGSIHRHFVIEPPQHGTLTLSGGRQRKLRYVPAPGFDGLDSAVVGAVDDEGMGGTPGTLRFDVGGTTGVSSAEPRAIALSAWPNPLRAGTTIEYSLAAGAPVDLAVFDVSGRRVAGLQRGVRPAGVHRVPWNPRSLPGGGPAPGVYFVRLVAGEARRTVRVVVAG